MAAADVFNTDRGDANGDFPVVARSASGTTTDMQSVTVPTTSIDDIGDFFGVIPVPEGAELTKVEETWTDADSHATPALDVDLVLRVYDPAGVATDTVLVNGGTRMQSAQTTPVIKHLERVAVTGSAKGYGWIGLKAIAAAATAVAMIYGLHAEWR